ncbi:hypothetical protein V501_03703 [Pseudogymnoascus sp. VKM F-4519 (FW-2642)]|nr:hypothetical protein V501_03703 [Pseudogymnoascus sp. VKM F-4519 (FW-2642)]
MAFPFLHESKGERQRRWNVGREGEQRRRESEKRDAAGGSWGYMGNADRVAGEAEDEMTAVRRVSEKEHWAGIEMMGLTGTGDEEL